MKSILSIIILLFFINIMFSQDIIYLKKGDSIQSKVYDIKEKIIKYKKYHFQDGPLYTIRKKEVKFIEYENGKKDYFINSVTPENIKNTYPYLISSNKNLRKVSIITGTGGALILTGIYTNIIPGYSHSIEQQGLILTIGSAVLLLYSTYKIKKYKKELNKVSFEVNISKNQKNLSISYRF